MRGCVTGMPNCIIKSVRHSATRLFFSSYTLYVLLHRVYKIEEEHLSVFAWLRVHPHKALVVNVAAKDIVGEIEGGPLPLEGERGSETNTGKEQRHKSE